MDLGLWKRPLASRLVIPVDSHVQQIARRIGLTTYRSPGWAMAFDTTRTLRELDPVDPVRYDFAIQRMGMLGCEDEIESLGRRR